MQPCARPTEPRERSRRAEMLACATPARPPWPPRPRSARQTFAARRARARALQACPSLGRAEARQQHGPRPAPPQPVAHVELDKDECARHMRAHSGRDSARVVPKHVLGAARGEGARACRPVTRDERAPRLGRRETLIGVDTAHHVARLLERRMRRPVREALEQRLGLRQVRARVAQRRVDLAAKHLARVASNSARNVGTDSTCARSRSSRSVLVRSVPSCKRSSAISCTCLSR